MATTNLCIKQTHRNAQDSYFTTGGLGPQGPQGPTGPAGTDWYLKNLINYGASWNVTLTNATSTSVNITPYSISSLELQNRGTLCFDISVRPAKGATTIPNTAFNQYFLSFDFTANSYMGNPVSSSGPQDVATLLNSSNTGISETNFKIYVPISTLTAPVGLLGNLRACLTTDGTSRSGSLTFTYKVVCYLC